MFYGNINIGISGWSYKEWKNIFYPAGLKSTDWLSFYATVFNIAEINSSFYHLPRRQVVEGWTKKVPAGFLFCPKVSNYITHVKKLKAPEETLPRFFEAFEPIQQQLGPILIQLPPSLPFDHDTVDHFFTILRENYSRYHFALEVRHSSWLAKGGLELLSKYNIAFVISQSGNYFPYAEVVTSQNIYVRFHGPGALYNSDYDEESLQRFAALFRKWMASGNHLWVFFNNTMQGHAIQNALRLRALVTAG